MRVALVLLAAVSALAGCGMFGGNSNTPVLYEVRFQEPASPGM